MLPGMKVEFHRPRGKNAGWNSLELYGKHDKSWRDWMVETYADRCAAFNIS
jgi:hypothetical protein